MAKTGQDLGGSLVARVEPSNGATWVILTGGISEAADFTSLTMLPGPLHFDLSGIERINSLGVRNWVQFVRSGEAAGLAMTFERCSPVLVQQISMISNFMGTRSRVRSLVVPYLCPSCHAEATQLVELSPEAPLQVPPSMPCPKCATAMQVDELEEMYQSLYEKLSGR